MNAFNLLPPFTYWLLIGMWTYILYFYLRRILSKKMRIPVLFTPLIILAIDAFRTLVESLYFGAFFTSSAGLLPPSVHGFLNLPQNLLIPKAFNVVAAGLIIGILLKRYIPEEERETERRRNHIQHLEAEVAKRTEELTSAYGALTQANAQLKELDQLKSNFIDITSHELRTPTFCIGGMLSILKKEISPECVDLQNDLDGAIRSADRLEKLIINTLKIMEGEQYEKRLDLAAVPMESMITGALSVVEPFTRLRGQEIIVSGLKDLPPAEVDPGKIHDVLINLLMNAIKFTPDGGRIFIDVLQPDSESVAVHVRDEGVGVAEEDQPHIFEKFFTGMDVLHHASGEYEFLRKGFGLGLAIVKKFIEMHGGCVGMTSAVGEGADFYFTIPLKRANDTQLEQGGLAA